MRTLLLLLSLVPIVALAQDYPSKPVRVIVGTSPGGSPDVFARLVTTKMSEAWGATFVVENKVGANGNIAAEMVSRSAPDGYTLYFCDSAIWAINPHVYTKVPYDPLGDFAGVSTVATLPTFLTVHPSVPAHTYAEFIAYAKANPGKLSYASAGIGSIHHITTELFKSMTGVQMVHVPYKGMGQGSGALVAGDVQVAFTSYTAIAAFAKAGKVRILANADGRRTPALPDIAQDPAAGYPKKPIRVVIGYAAGGGSDIVPRLVLERVGAKWGQPFLVENRPGASGHIATEIVYKAAPDGYTLLSTPPAFATTPFLFSSLPFDPD